MCSTYFIDAYLSLSLSKSIEFLSNFNIKKSKSSNNGTESRFNLTKQNPFLPRCNFRKKRTKEGGRKNSTRHKNRRFFFSPRFCSNLSRGREGYCFSGGNKNNQAAIVKTDRFESNRSEGGRSRESVAGFRWRVFAIVREA